MRSEDQAERYAEIARYERSGEGAHHHRGKSSEGLLNQATILGALGIEAGWTVLDAGCGNGYMARAFSKRVGAEGRVFALDPDEAAISALRAETSGSNITAVVGDITFPTDLPPEAFDLIYLSNVLHGFSPGRIKGFPPADRHRRQSVGLVGEMVPVPGGIVFQRSPFLVPQEIQVSRHRAPGDAKLFHEVRAVGRIPGGFALPHHLDHAPNPVILWS